MKYKPQSRRMFLQGMGTLLPIPFLYSLLPKESWAQAPTTIRRYISVINNYDYGRHTNWFPNMMAQPSQVLNSALGDQTLHMAPLNSYLTSSTSSLSPIFGNALNQHLNQINLMCGLDQSTRIGHGNAHIMGNIRATDGHDTEAVKLEALRTIDQVLRDSTTFNSINRDVAIIGNANSRSHRRSGTTIIQAPRVANSLQELYNYFFNGGMLPETGSGTTTQSNPRRDLLSSVYQDYQRIRNGRQISSFDRDILDSALAKISDVQNILAPNQVSTGACRYKTISRTGDGESFYTSTQTMKAYADLIVAAIMCDVTRVFSMSTNLNEDVYDTNPNADFHQGISHVPFLTLNGKENWQYIGEIQRDFVKNFMAPLLNGLAGAIDPSNSRSYLYNSLVHYTLECGQVHGFNSQPAFLAGNAGGNLTSGYFLDYTNRTKRSPWPADSFSPTATDINFSNEYTGVPYNRLFNTILQAMGVTPTEYENPGINTYFQNRSDSMYGAINNGISNIGGYGHWGPPTSNYGEYLPRTAEYNLHYFKNVLPMPNANAG